MEQDFTVWWGLRPKPRRCVGPTRANRLPHRSDRCGHCSAKGHAPTRFKSSRPDWFVTANPANGCESHCWRDLNFCTDVSLLAAFTPRKAPDHAGKPLEHFRPTKLGSSESLFAPGLRHVEAGVLEEDSRPVTLGFGGTRNVWRWGEDKSSGRSATEPSRATRPPASPRSPSAPRRARRLRGCRCSACPCPCWRRAGPVAATCR